MRFLLGAAKAMLVAVSMAQFAAAQDAPQRTIISNVQVFDGVNEALIENASALIEDNLIASVSTDPIEAEGATVIDGGGRTLMPGIIDSHIHLMVGNIGAGDILNELPGYMTIRAAIAAEQVLDQGVTTVRELCGETFTLKRAIDEGLIPGPRIFPSGAFITQTSGHFDFRGINAANPSLTGDIPEFSRNQVYMVDSPDAVRAAARENLRRGASQLKLAIGGGVSSPTDPIDTTQFTEAEIAAAVEAAENWGTYVTVHGYTDRAVNQAIDAGVKSIEHGQLLSEETIQRMADEGVWLSFQPFTECSEPNLTPLQNAKQAIVCQGTAKIYELMKKIPELKVTHSTDVFLNPEGGQTGITEQMHRLEKWFTPFEILKMATSNPADLLSLSGPRSPYQEGALGVVAEGAYADLLLVDGNPLEDLAVVTDADNIRIIMTDGELYKNTLEN